MSQPVPEWERLVYAGRPKWEDDEPVSPPAAPSSDLPRHDAELQPQPYQTRAVEPPRRGLDLGWPYRSRETWTPNPRGLNTRELAALQRFFKTRSTPA
jgi:hypothetical protein